MPDRLPLNCRDSIIYSANCGKLKDQMVAIKMYNKTKLSPSKMRAIKREAAMMIYMTRKRCGFTAMTHAALLTTAQQPVPLGISTTDGNTDQLKDFTLVLKV